MHRVDTGDVCLTRVTEREMTVLIMVAKAVMLIALALAAFAGLAVMLGFEPPSVGEVAKCAAAPKQICLFTIL